MEDPPPGLRMLDGSEQFPTGIGDGNAFARRKTAPVPVAFPLEVQHLGSVPIGGHRSFLAHEAPVEFVDFVQQLILVVEDFVDWPGAAVAGNSLLVADRSGVQKWFQRWME